MGASYSKGPGYTFPTKKDMHDELAKPMHESVTAAAPGPTARVAQLPAGRAVELMCEVSKHWLGPFTHDRPTHKSRSTTQGRHVYAPKGLFPLSAVALPQVLPELSSQRAVAELAKASGSVRGALSSLLLPCPAKAAAKL